MKKYLNGKIVDLTQEEIDQIEKDRLEFEEQEKHRTPTAEERLEALEGAMLELLEVYNG